MITLVIPVFNNHKLTTRLLDSIYENSIDELEIIIIDNGSDTPLRYSIPESQVHHKYRYVRNKKNIGCFPAVRQGFDLANGDIVAFLHNDLIIHEYGWDVRVQSAFDNDDEVALAGFFGSRAVDVFGAKIDTISNMLGLEIGDSWEEHSELFTGECQVVSLDSLSMIFRSKYLDKIKMDDLPPHHWFDRIISMRYHDAGYKVMLIGIAFDHSSVGQSTYTTQKSKFEEFCEEWCKSRGITLKIPGAPDNVSWDLAVANYGKLLWDEIWKIKLIEKLKKEGTIDFNNRIFEHTDDFNFNHKIVIEYNRSMFL